MVKYEVIKRSKEFRYKDRFEIVEGCTVTDPEPEIIESFDTLVDAMAFFFTSTEDIITSISKYKSNTDTIYVVTEYVIQENEYDSDGENISNYIKIWYITKMFIFIKDEHFDEVAIFHSYKDAENFMNHDERELRMEF